MNVTSLHDPTASAEPAGHLENRRHEPARETYAKLHANNSGPHCQGQTSQEAQAALNEIDALRADVRALVIAAGRMLDQWAEGDDAVKQQLWRALHTAADDADDRHGIYPL